MSRIDLKQVAQMIFLFSAMKQGWSVIPLQNSRKIRKIFNDNISNDATIYELKKSRKIEQSEFDQFNSSEEYLTSLINNFCDIHNDTNTRIFN